MYINKKASELAIKTGSRMRHFFPSKFLGMREGMQLSFSSAEHPKITEAYSKIIDSLCRRHNGECNYSGDIDWLVKSHEPNSRNWLPSYQSGEHFLKAALSQLRDCTLVTDSRGRVTNTQKLGRELGEAIRFINQVADIFVLVDKCQLENGKFPFSASYKSHVGSMLENGEKEAVVLILAKTAPAAIRYEILEKTENEFHGLTSWLLPENISKHAGIMSPQLQDYLAHNTIRIMCTGSQAEIKGMEAAMNAKIESKGGVEEHHVARVVRSIGEDQKINMLKRVGLICGGMLLAVELIKHTMPRWINVVGGALGELIGSVIPSVSQSFKALGTLRQKLEDAKPEIKGGIAGVGASLALGALSTFIYKEGMPIWAGFIFGLACCCGAIGTAYGAMRDAYRAISEQSKAENMHLSRGKKLRMAYQEAILNVPFRIGNTLIAIPVQLAAGLLSGEYGFFTYPVFVMFEGVFDPLIGTLMAFIYPKMANRKHRKMIKEI